MAEDNKRFIDSVKEGLTEAGGKIKEVAEKTGRAIAEAHDPRIKAEGAKKTADFLQRLAEKTSRLPIAGPVSGVLPKRHLGKIAGGAAGEVAEEMAQDAATPWAHIKLTDRLGNVLEEYDRELLPATFDDMFSEPRLMMKERIRNTKRPPVEKPIETEKKGIDVKPFSTEEFLNRMAK